MSRDQGRVQLVGVLVLNEILKKENKNKLSCTTHYCDLTGGYKGNDSGINETKSIFAEYFDLTVIDLAINDE